MKSKMYMITEKLLIISKKRKSSEIQSKHWNYPNTDIGLSQERC